MDCVGDHGVKRVSVSEAIRSPKAFPKGRKALEEDREPFREDAS